MEIKLVNVMPKACTEISVHLIDFLASYLAIHFQDAYLGTQYKNSSRPTYGPRVKIPCFWWPWKTIVCNFNRSIASNE